MALLKACCGISFYECCPSDSNRLQDDWSNCGFHFLFLGSQQHFFFGDEFSPFGKVFFQNTNIWICFLEIAMFCHIV